LQEWKDNAGNALTSIDAAGNVQLAGTYLAMNETAAPATPVADQARLFLDAGSGEVSVKKDDGSVVSLESGESGTGITALNTLTAATQAFATGTTGTDFAISSAGSTHTLNLPLASATSSGKLSSADWSAFDAKQPGDGDLTALAELGTAGIIARTGSGTASTRALAGTANEISVANADAVSGNPTISIASTFDVSGKSSTKPIKSGTTLPGACGVGEYFFKSDAAAGQNTYACTATDTWALQGGGGWRKWTISDSDLTAAADTQDLTLFNAGGLEKVEAVVVKHSTSFTGGVLSGLTVSVGVAGAENFYTEAHDVFQAANDLSFQDTNVFGSFTMAAAGHSVIARFAAIGDDVVNATAGTVDIWVKVSILP
jgi:hypothetical protein